MQKLDVLQQGVTRPEDIITIRVITISEGIAFCSVSVGGGAIVSRPGETIVFELTPQMQAVNVPHGGYQPLGGGYVGQQQLGGGYYTTTSVSHYNLTVSKITELPD